MIKDQPMNPECAGVYGQNFYKNEFKTKDNATPRPWRLYAPDRPLKEFIDVCIDKSPDHQNYEARIITNIDNANDPEYRILCILGNGPKADANARLIVKAVNEYDTLKEGIDRRTIEIARQQAINDELVEALKEVIKERDFYFVHPKAKEMINKALKKASQ